MRKSRKTLFEKLLFVLNLARLVYLDTEVGLGVVNRLVNGIYGVDAPFLQIRNLADVKLFFRKQRQNVFQHVAAFNAEAVSEKERQASLRRIVVRNEGTDGKNTARTPLS